VYRIDIPGIAQSFGLVGGVIIVFMFTFFTCVESFNTYKMRYLIGRELYLLKKKKKKQEKEAKASSLKEINNYSEVHIMWAWMISPLGYFSKDYNRFGDVLRHITLIQNRVEEDLNLYKYFGRLSAIESEINRNFNFREDPLLKVT
jgi:hypothetical protein